MDMQTEVADVWAKLSDNEWHLVRHQRGYERHIPAQPVELGDNHGAATATSLRKRGRQYWATIQSVSAFASLNLYALSGDGMSLRLCKLVDAVALSFKSQTRLTLLLGTDSDVADYLTAHRFISRDCINFNN
jgi:hypothetical protein